MNRRALIVLLRTFAVVLLSLVVAPRAVRALKEDPQQADPRGEGQGGGGEAKYASSSSKPSESGWHCRL